MSFLHFIFSCILCTSQPAYAATGETVAAGPAVDNKLVVFSELNWAGSDLSAADEWIEITNYSNVIINLAGWKITYLNSQEEEKEIISFGSGAQIVPGQYLLISNYAADSDKSRLSSNPDFVSTKVSLANSKLLVRLYDTAGEVRDEADDFQGAPFAGWNNQGGIWASMERIDFGLSGNIAGNWKTSVCAYGFDEGSPSLGTPGFSGQACSENQNSDSDESDDVSFGYGYDGIFDEEPVVFGYGYGDLSGENIDSEAYKNIKITEILANPAGKDDEEWIEIANLGDVPVTIAGWILDDENSPDKFVIPENRNEANAYPPDFSPGFILLAGEHVSFRKSVSGLPLGNSGEQVSLYKGEELVDGFFYSETAESVSYGRNPENLQQLKSFCLPTEGKPNSNEPPPVIINIQSGETKKETPLSINLEAVTVTGSLSSACCYWDFGDSFESFSCNPPSHKFSETGTYQVMLTVQTFCGQSVTDKLEVTVLPKTENYEQTEALNDLEDDDQAVCENSNVSGIFVSEFLPDPYGEEMAEEWIELKNITGRDIQLCQLYLDDISGGGSKPFNLSEYKIKAGGYLVLKRPETKIALNNNEDSVRMYKKLDQEEIEIQIIDYLKAPEGETYALRSDGLFVWTIYPTPGEENRFRSAQRKYPRDTIIVSSVLPNPVGEDKEGEWIEITNVSDQAVTLDGWWLDNKEGGSKSYSLDDVVLKPQAHRRFMITETNITLVNSFDQARLLDPDGYLVSVISWTEAVSGRIYYPPVMSTARLPAKVINVVDGDTADIVLTDLSDYKKIPDSLLSRWRYIAETDHPYIRVRFIGIDTPESVHPNKAVEVYGLEAAAFTRDKLGGKSVELVFDDELWDKYNRLLAYVYFPGGESIQEMLLSNGLAYVYTRFPFRLMDRYVLLEEEAKKARLGIWGDEETLKLLEEVQDDQMIYNEVLEKGLSISVDPEFGLVASGTVVTAASSVAADLFINFNDDQWQPFSGEMTIAKDVTFSVYAEITIPADQFGESKEPVIDHIKNENGSVTVRSEIIEAFYILKKDEYKVEAVISEVYPSPLTAAAEPFDQSTPKLRLAGELRVTPLRQFDHQEWIELYNPTDHLVSLIGWILDDEREKGSSPYVLGPEAIIDPGGYLIIKNEQSGLALNNDGDEVWLLAPDESVGTSVKYEKVEKGWGVVSVMVSLTNHDTNKQNGAIPRQARDDTKIIARDDTEVAWDNTKGDNYCLTQVPTPGEKNLCVIFKTGKDIVDSDNDFLPDDQEQYLYKSDPLNPDTDGDKWLDGFEAEAGMDINTYDVWTKRTQYLYKEFVLNKLKPQWKLYKTKGLIIKGKDYPFNQIKIAIGDENYGLIKPEENNQLWEYKIAKPLPPGNHLLDLELTDTAGRIVFLHQAMEILLDEAYELNKKDTAKLKSNKKGFLAMKDVFIRRAKLKYKNFVQQSQNNVLVLENDQMVVLEDIKKLFIEKEKKKILSTNGNDGKTGIPEAFSMVFSGLGGLVWIKRKIYF